MSLKKISSFVVMNLKKYELNIFFRVSFFLQKTSIMIHLILHVTIYGNI